MYQPVPLTSPEEQACFCALAGLSDLTPPVLALQRPEESWMLVDDGDSVAARCSLWWSGTPPHGGHRLGFVGHYAVRERQAAGPLLALASERLAANGCTLAVAPIDGNTWRRYRLLTERGTEPAFFLEPDNPDDWPAHFTDHGFTPLAQYFSALNADLSRQDPRMATVAEVIAAYGILLRPLDAPRFEEELRSIHALSLASFADNFLYTPIGEEEFVLQYRGIRPHVRPELVLIAELDGQAVGYVFAVPDVLQARRGVPVDTVIVKTVAVHPDRRSLGLGGLLVARCHEAARELGYARAIHALMYETNVSRRISSHTARFMRRYTLFAKPLGARP
jgi:GNAT superfamily N-acetyltransferase